MFEYKPIGGVELCRLHFADSVDTLSFEEAGCKVKFADEGIEVRLIDNSSTFVEKVECDKGVISVVHTLRLAALRNDAQRWLDDDFMQNAAYRGLIARLVLNDGRKLVVGLSRHLDIEQPMRLESLVCDSGSSPSSAPTVTLKLRSTDTALAAAII